MNQDERRSTSWERVKKGFQQITTPKGPWKPILKKNQSKPIASTLIIKPEPPKHELFEDVECWLRYLQKKKVMRLGIHLEMIQWQQT